MLQGYAMANTKRNIEEKFVDNLQVLSYTRVHDNMNNRNVIAVTRESEILTGLIPMVYRSFIQAPFTIAAFFILMLVISIKLTLTILLLVCIVVGCSALLRKSVKLTSKKLYARYSDMHQIFADWLRGFKVIILYNALSLMHRQLKSVVNDTCDLSKKLVRIYGIQAITIESLTYAVLLLFLIIVSSYHSELRLQTFVSVPTAILFIRNESIKASRGYVQLAGTESSVKYLVGIITSPPRENVLPDWEFNTIDEIIFHNVSFAYDEFKPILIDASWHIAPGEVNVLIGDSGAGKSTCLELLSTLRKPQNGYLSVNGHNILNFNNKSILRRIAYVEQEPFIFEGSLRENFLLDNTYSDKIVVDFCKQFKLTNIVENKADLDRQITGKDLSVGEKQRIAFIRALLRSPDVYLFDEISSNVDNETKQLMLKYISEIASDKLVVYVTHDRDVIKTSKRVTLLSNYKLHKFDNVTSE